MLVDPLQQELEQVFSGSDERGKDLTLQKKFLFCFSLPSQQPGTTPVSSAGALGRDGPPGTSVPRFSMPHSSSTLLVMFHHWHSYT